MTPITVASLNKWPLRDIAARSPSSVMFNKNKIISSDVSGMIFISDEMPAIIR